MYLCLAYGAEQDWIALSEEEQEGLSAQDERLRQRGALMAAVETTVTTVRAWDGVPTTDQAAFARPPVPLAGFSVIEADSLEEAVRLVADTPCARAKGAIEIRAIMTINDQDWRHPSLQDEASPS